MLKQVNRLLIWLASWAVMPVSVLWVLCQLVRHVGKFRRADLVFHDVYMSNYGTAMCNIAVALRHHKGKNILMSLLFERGSTHNLKLGLIYRDVNVLFLRKPCLVFHIMGRKFRIPSDRIFIPVKEAVAKFFMSLFAPKASFEPFARLVDYQKPPPEFQGIIPENYAGTKIRGLCSAFLFIAHCKAEHKDHSLSELKLPEPIRRNIHQKLVQARQGKPARLCMLYNKLEENADSPRQGSPLEAYLPAVRLLVARGYQVLLAGDKFLEGEALEAFNGMVVTAWSLEVDLDLFRLFTATEADILIGESGGGFMLPLVVGLPILALNYYPFGIGAPGTWVYPKRYTDLAGNFVPYERAIAEDLYGYYDPDRPGPKPLSIIPVCNSEEEITEAVSHFLEDLENPDGEAPGEELMKIVPEMSLFHIYGSRFSPSFIRRDREVSAFLDSCAPRPRDREAG